MGRQNINGYHRQKTSLGKMRTVNVQINDLPPIGTEVVVYENVLLPERLKRKKGVPTLYMPSDSYLDAHDQPRSWVISKYTGGIEEPLERSNWVELVDDKNKYIKFRTSIRTVLIATGHFKLVPIENIEPLQEGGIFLPEGRIMD